MYLVYAEDHVGKPADGSGQPPEGVLYNLGH
jgi:hypothetical protein